MHRNKFSLKVNLCKLERTSDQWTLTDSFVFLLPIQMCVVCNLFFFFSSLGSLFHCDAVKDVPSSVPTSSDKPDVDTNASTIVAISTSNTLSGTEPQTTIQSQPTPTPDSTITTASTNQPASSMANPAPSTNQPTSQSQTPSTTNSPTQTHNGITSILPSVTVSQHHSVKTTLFYSMTPAEVGQGHSTEPTVPTLTSRETVTVTTNNSTTQSSPTTESSITPKITITSKSTSAGKLPCKFLVFQHERRQSHWPDGKSVVDLYCTLLTYKCCLYHSQLKIQAKPLQHSRQRKGIKTQVRTWDPEPPPWSPPSHQQHQGQQLTKLGSCPHLPPSPPLHPPLPSPPPPPQQQEQPPLQKPSQGQFT